MLIHLSSSYKVKQGWIQEFIQIQFFSGKKMYETTNMDTQILNNLDLN